VARDNTVPFVSICYNQTNAPGVCRTVVMSEDGTAWDISVSTLLSDAASSLATRAFAFLFDLVDSHTPESFLQDSVCMIYWTRCSKLHLTSIRKITLDPESTSLCPRQVISALHPLVQILTRPTKLKLFCSAWLNIAGRQGGKANL